MTGYRHIILMFVLCLCYATAPVLAEEAAEAESQVSDNIRIESAQLKYALQYRVYTPPNYDPSAQYPTIYVTDGQWYLEYLYFRQTLDRQIKKGAIEPIVAVFLDSRNPDDLKHNRRKFQFFCVKEFVGFFRHELVPEVTKNYGVSTDRTKRAILGLSFGGLNAGCFGLMAHDLFEGIAMQSPAIHVVPTLYPAYANEPKRPIRVFLSIGDEKDITVRGYKLRDALKKKGYPLKFIKNNKTHDFHNWRPLMDEVLRFFFKK